MGSRELPIINKLGLHARAHCRRQRAYSQAILVGVNALFAGAELEHEAAVLAGKYRLRGADAVYTAVAQQYGTTLVSRDREHLTRVAGIVLALHPAVALAALFISPTAP